MPRRNLYLLWFLGLFCLLCYAQSDPLGRVLAQTLRRIQWRYIEKVDEKKLFEGAVNGMFDTLEREFGDQNSTYIPPALVPDFDREVSKEYKGGLGMVLGVDPKTGQFVVLSPMFGSPASLGGIQANDRIVAIDGEPVKGLTLTEAIQKMKGKISKPVVLRIQRPKQGAKEGPSAETPEELDITLNRASIKIDTVLGDKRAADGAWTFTLEGHDKIGYIRITSFAKYTTEEMQCAMAQLPKDSLKGLIIDLRDNPGGYLDCAVEICDMFIDSGRIVTTRGRASDFWDWFGDENPPKPADPTDPKRLQERDKYDATEEGTLDKNFPVAVLINGESASAAEIIAACLQDHHRAKIIGKRSYGKGTVQEILPIGGGRGTLKLTAASYWRPNEKNIHKPKDAKDEEDWGVRPDPGFEVPIDRDTRKTIYVTRNRRDVNYNKARRFPEKLFLSEYDEKPKNGSAKKATKKRLPLIDPSTPMIDVDPQLRKAVEWIEKGEE